MKRTFSALTLVLFTIICCAGCSTTANAPAKQEGEININAPHALTPKDGEVYRIQNLKQPGGKVFLFPNESALADCYFALESGGDAKEFCWSAVEAEVEDGELVKAVECHKGEHAICMLQVLEGESAGVKGTVLWDWLAPRTEK